MISRRARKEFPCEALRLAHFVDREPELERVREVLSSPAGTVVPVLVFHGVGGMGKTAVLDKIRYDLCLRMELPEEKREGVAEVPHAWVGFSLAAAAVEGGVRSRTGMLHQIKRELAAHGLKFPRFELVWARYRELGTGQMFQASRASRDDFGTLLDIMEEVPAAGSVLGLFRRAAQLERFAKKPYTRLDLEEGLRWHHPYEAAEALAEALADDVSENVERLGDRYGYRWPVLFFDSLEWLEAGGEESELTLRAVQDLCRYLAQVPVIIGSRPLVDWEREAIGGREVENHAVDVIPEGNREEYLKSRGVGQRSWGPIIEVTGGHALWMGIAVDIALDVQAKERRPATRADLLGRAGKTEELLDRLLERLGADRPMRETVRAACVCRWFDEWLLRAVRGQTDDFAGQFDELCELSFVMPVETDEEGRLVRGQIHQTVRELVVGQLRKRGELERLARRGAEHCEGQEGEDWQAEQVYFLMMAEPQEGIRLGGELFDRVNFEWNRGLGEAVLEASRDGWSWRHAGQEERAPEPWQFADREGDLLGMEGNPSGALRAYGSALQGARGEGHRYGEGLVLNTMGNLHSQQGRYEEAMGLYEQSLQILRELGDQQGEGVTLNNMAIIHEAQGRYEQAMGLYEQGLAICRELGDRHGQGATLNNMAGVHQLQGRYEEAMGLYEQSLQILRELGDQQGEGVTLNNMAIIHEAQGRYEQAMGLYEQGLAICRELGDRHGEGQTLNNMAEYYERQGRYEEAMGLYEQSLEIKRELGDRRGEGQTLENMGLLAGRMGDVEKAREYWKEALDALQGLGVPEEVKVRKLLEALGEGQ